MSIGVIFLFIILFGALTGIRGDAGHKTPGIMGLILFGAVTGAVRAIWKSGKKSNDGDDNDSSVLQK